MDRSSSGSSISSSSSPNSIPPLVSEGTTDEDIIFSKLTATEISKMSDDIWGYGGVDFYLRLHTMDSESEEGLPRNGQTEIQMPSTDETESESCDEQANRTMRAYGPKVFPREQAYVILSSSSSESAADERPSSASSLNVGVPMTKTIKERLKKKKRSEARKSGASSGPTASTSSSKNQDVNLLRSKTSRRQRNASRTKKPTAAVASTSTDAAAKTGRPKASKKHEGEGDAERAIRRAKKLKERERQFRRHRRIGKYSAIFTFIGLLIAVMASLAIQRQGQEPDWANALKAKGEYARSLLED